MKDCVFCKIVRGELPAREVYENNSVTGILDILTVNRICQKLKKGLCG